MLLGRRKVLCTVAEVYQLSFIRATCRHGENGASLGTISQLCVQDKKCCKTPACPPRQVAAARDEIPEPRFSPSAIWLHKSQGFLKNVGPLQVSHST